MIIINVDKRGNRGTYNYIEDTQSGSKGRNSSAAECNM